MRLTSRGSRVPWLLPVLVAVTLVACGERSTPVSPRFDSPSIHPLVVPGLLGAIAVDVGDRHNCAIQADATLVCWGQDSWGKIWPPAGTFTFVSAGDNHNCAIRTNGSLACWGRNGDGESTPPAGSFVQVDVGQQFSCGVRDDGSLTCWGRSDHGQTSPPGGSFIDVSAGDHGACAIRTDGTLACWGGASFTSSPSGTFQRVAAGGSYACALATDGTIACWGFTADGRTSPPSGQFTQLARGYALKHNCALRPDGTVACWGLDAEGESTPPAGTFTQVFVGGHHSCAIGTDGLLTCWGSNEYGQSTPPTGRVLPTATFAATPSAPVFGSTFSLSLTSAQVPGHPQATAFTYAFDCGDGTGYAAATPNASTSCPASTVGARTVRGKVFDQDGDSAEYSATVDVTQGAQTITFTSQPPNPAVLRGTYAVSATGGASGNPVVFTSLTPATCSVSGTTVSLDAVGTCTIAANQGGSATYTPAPQVTQTFAIVYGFVGFTQPVDNLPTINTANSGQAIPLKWRLVDANGVAITNLGSVTVTVTSLSCSIGSTPDQVEEYATGSSGLQNLGNGYYQFNWKTPKTYAQSCKTMLLDLGDGTTHAAVFNFTK